MLISASQVVPDVYILLKELVENSIDAKSDRITIGIVCEKETFSFAMQDNGEGVEVNENFLSLGGTSKHTSETYGCKGAALYSISQIGELYINTKRAGQIRSTEVHAHKDKVLKKDGYRPENGTTVRIKNFHRDSPVRYAYLAKNIGEYARNMVALARKCTVAHRVEFIVEMNGKQLFSSALAAKDKSVLRVARSFGVREACSVFKIKRRQFTLRGIVAEGAGAEGVMCADGRIVESRKILQSLTTLAKNLDKKIVFYLEVLERHPEEKERMNIGTRSNKHHRLIYKELLIAQEIENLQSREEMQRSAGKAPRAHPILSFIKGNRTEYTWRSTEIEENPDKITNTPAKQAQIGTQAEPQRSKTQKESEKPGPEGCAQNKCGSLRKDTETPEAREDISHQASVFGYAIDSEENLVICEHKEGIPLQREEIKDLGIVGQFNNGFIIATQKKNGHTLFYAIDQHSADEAVNYENLKKAYAYSRQVLIRPAEVFLSEYERYLVDENRAFLKSHGFVLSEDCMAILEAPAYDSGVFGEAELRELLETVKESRNTKVIFSELRKALATKACRTSIMIGEPLGKDQMQDILNNLSETSRPWNCPHGRPTIALIQKHPSQ